MRKRKFNKPLMEQYRLQGEKCAYCGEETPFEDVTRDHFDPKSLGNNLVENKVFCCWECNQAKANLDIYEFKDKTFDDICVSLHKVIKQEWKIREDQYRNFQKLSNRFKTINSIIDSGGKPKIIFT